MPEQTAEVLGIEDMTFNILVFEADMECFEVFTVLSPGAGSIY